VTLAFLTSSSIGSSAAAIWSPFASLQKETAPKIESTARYLCIEIDDASEIAKKIDVRQGQGEP